MTPSRDDAALFDMIQAAQFVVEWMDGLDKGAFLADRKTQSAVQRQLEILGEAAKRLSAAYREQHVAVPWRRVAGLRDVLIHRYDAVDLDLLWETVSAAVPQLLAQLESLVSPPPERE